MPEEIGDKISQSDRPGRFEKNEDVKEKVKAYIINELPSEDKERFTIKYLADCYNADEEILKEVIEDLVNDDFLIEKDREEGVETQYAVNEDGLNIDKLAA